MHSLGLMELKFNAFRIEDEIRMYETLKLDNGIKVIAHPISGHRSISIGIWIKTGSILETPENNGVSHFIEHMLFKGTNTRTAKDIAMQVDGLGGELNAFTSKECTCFYARVLDDHTAIAVDILNDMLQNSKFDNEDMRKEKMIILDEIFMYEDSPEDLVYDILSDLIFKDHPLGRPILGSESSLKGLTKASVIEYMQQTYTADQMVIAVAGHYEKESLFELLNKTFGKAKVKMSSNKTIEKPQFHRGWVHRWRDIEQVHLNIGYKGIHFEHEDAYALLILNNIIGGSTSSRLFQVVREDHGLSYSVYSHPSFYEAMGLLSVYASMNPENLDQIVEIMLDILSDFASGSITDDEIRQSKEQLKGSYILGLEGTENIMNMMGKSVLFTDRVKSTEEVLEKIDTTSPDRIRELAIEILTSDQMALATVGKIDDAVVEKIYKKFDALKGNVKSK
ncbi:M16 family metallopeptidase [Fusibacter sp. JL216-2]|uniref:M16 family metallopeptidase n=1 Tax=Fusibacter sp. JL216-2 TaxID=3071453 RepID=UPI003D344D91